MKVVDFGLALAGEGAWRLAGTLPYMAPELLLGSTPTAASDLYAVGVLAHQLLAGDLPYDVSQLTQLLHQMFGSSADLTFTADVAAFLASHQKGPLADATAAISAQPLPDNVGPALRTVLARLLARTPEERYSDALAVLRDLAAATGMPLVEETADTRESFLQAAQLVGRDRELGQLVDALRNAQHGHGSIWLLGGESGVGKSRLMDELRTEALIREARVLRAQAAREEGSAFYLLRDVVEPLGLEVPISDADLGILLPLFPRLSTLLQRSGIEAPTLDARGMQERAVLTIASLIESAAATRSHPLVILLEDLQWAGKESLALLAHLSSLASQRALLVIGTYRDDEQPELPAATPGATVLKLRGLEGSSVAVLSESMLGPRGCSDELTEFLQRESSGNPFFIVEIMRALAEEAGELRAVTQQRLPAHILTGGVRAVLEHRIAQVPSWAAPLLSLAAVMGRQLDPQVLAQSEAVAAMAGHSLDTWLMHGANRSILEVRDQRWQFAHDKLRECIVEQLSASGQLAAVHRDAALSIERAHPGPALDAHMISFAHHNLEALPLLGIDKVLNVVVRAAELAMQQLSFAEAAALLDRAHALIQTFELDILRRFELLLLLGQAHIRAGNHDRGKQACELAAELARKIDDPVLLARAAITCGSEFSPGVTDPKMVALLEEALRALPSADHPLRARAMARLAAALQPAPDPQVPIAMAREAVAMARRLGDPVTLSATLVAACSAFAQLGQPQERLELDLELVRLATQFRDRVQAQRGHLRLVFDCAELGDLAGMDASIQSYELGAREFRQAQYQWPALMLRAMQALMAGHFAESDRLTTAAHSIGERHKDSNATVCTSMHRIARFHASESYPELLEAETQFRASHGNFSKRTPVQWAISVWCQARAGLFEPTRTAIAALRDSPILLRYRVLLPLVAEACLLVGDTELAQKMYPRLAPDAEYFYTRGATGMYLNPPCTQPMGLLAMALGRWPDAVQHLEHALSRSESIGLRAHLARLRYQCAQALLGRGAPGDGERAQVLLSQAAELATTLGQTGLLPLIEQLRI